jgi:hypothetical protein
MYTGTVFLKFGFKLVIHNQILLKYFFISIYFLLEFVSKRLIVYLFHCISIQIISQDKQAFILNIPVVDHAK